MVETSRGERRQDDMEEMRKLMETIRAEGEKRISKLDTVFNDEYRAIIKKTEDTGLEIQNKVAMFERLIRTQSLIKRRPKETEFERSMKVVRNAVQNAKRPTTVAVGDTAGTTTGTTEMYEGSETSTTWMPTSDSHVDSKCSAAATSVDDKDMTKSGGALQSTEIVEDTRLPTATASTETEAGSPSPPRDASKFSLTTIKDATMQRFGQWRKGAARIFHIGKSATKKTSKKKGMTRLRSRMLRKRRLLEKAAIAPTTASAGVGAAATAQRPINNGRGPVRRRRKQAPQQQQQHKQQQQQQPAHTVNNPDIPNAEGTANEGGKIEQTPISLSPVTAIAQSEQNTTDTHSVTLTDRSAPLSYPMSTTAISSGKQSITSRGTTTKRTQAFKTRRRNKGVKHVPSKIKKAHSKPESTPANSKEAKSQNPRESTSSNASGSFSEDLTMTPSAGSVNIVSKESVNNQSKTDKSQTPRQSPKSVTITRR